MESINNNNNNQNLMFLSEFKELRKELSAVKKRIVQLEVSREEQQERINILERENHSLKTQLNIDFNKGGESALKRKRTEKVQAKEKETESKTTSASTSAGKKKTKTNNYNDDEEAVVISRYDNGDSFDSLSDDLLHKIVEFNGNCYSKFGLINKRCKNIYDVKEYKLEKKTCVFGYGTVDKMLERYLQKRREGELNGNVRFNIAEAMIRYNRLDAIDWMVQLGDRELLQKACQLFVVFDGRINILSKVFCKCNLTMLDKLLRNDGLLCYQAALNGQLEALKCLRKYGAVWDALAFNAARDNGHDEIVQYLRAEGLPEQHDDIDGESLGSELRLDDIDGESLGSEQVGLDGEDGDN